MKTMYQGINSEDVTIRAEKKALKNALAVVFGDNADCYFEMAIKNNGYYELGLAPKYALEVYENL